MFARVQLLALAMVAAAASAQASLPANCARNYTVHLGDTCDIISAALNVSTFQLAFANSNIDPLCDNLAEGEPLCLGITGQDCTTTHVIQSGDLCTTIAQTAGIDESVLLANNRNVNNVCSNIYPGEVLCTASTIIPYSS